MQNLYNVAVVGSATCAVLEFCQESPHRATAPHQPAAPQPPKYLDLRVFEEVFWRSLKDFKGTCWQQLGGIMRLGLADLVKSSIAHFRYQYFDYWRHGTLPCLQPCKRHLTGCSLGSGKMTRLDVNSNSVAAFCCLAFNATQLCRKRQEHSEPQAPKRHWWSEGYHDHRSS